MVAAVSPFRPLFASPPPRSASLPPQEDTLPCDAMALGGGETFELTVPAQPKLLPVPDTRQSTTYSCGAAALQAVLMYYGEEYIESELMEKLGTTTNGTNPRDIVRVASDLGFNAEVRENLTIADLEASVAKGQPVIIAAQAWREDKDTPWKDRWEDGHYMVVIGTDKDYVYFEDPSLLGSKGKIPRQEFMERWHDIDEKPYVQSGIFITGKPPAPPPAVLFVE